MGERQSSYGAGKIVHGGISTDVPHGLTGQGRPEELPGGGMPRTSGGEDSDVVKFHAPACPRNRGHFGEGKHTPPTVPPMRHYVPLVYTEQKSPCQNTVCQGIGAEEAVVSRGGIEG